MTTFTPDTCPLRLRIPVSLVGGLVVILNTDWMFIVPSIFSVFLVYPWLYRKIRCDLRNENTIHSLRRSLLFSFYVATVAAVLIGIINFALGVSTMRVDSWISYIGAFAYMLFFYFFMACVLMPAIIVIGIIVEKLNYAIIKKYYHPNVETKS